MYNLFWKGDGTDLKQRTTNPKKTVVDLFRESVIFSLLECFLDKIYNSLKNGFFGQILSHYPSLQKKRAESAQSALGKTFIGRKILLPLRKIISLSAEESLFFSLIRRFIDYLLKCRLRVYATFLLTFGLYAAMISLFRYLGDTADPTFAEFFAAVMLVFASVPLFSSGMSLSEALLSSAIAQPICAFLGIRQKSIRTSGYRGRSNIAFILGMLFGLSTYAVSILYMLLAFATLFMLYRIFMTPELGVAALFLLMPFAPTMALAALLIYTALCYFAKLLLGKRELHLESLDIAVLLFAFTLLLGGILSFSEGSLKPSLLLTCFIGGYFLTVLLIRTEEWLNRCTWAAILSATAVSLYGIFQYLTGSIGAKGAWLDAEMFGDIAGRVVSTLENPNMLAEYLILIFPLAACRFITRGTSVQRASALCAGASIFVCLILTWSRGAWLGLLIAGLFFLLIWHRRAMYLIFAGVLSIPLLPFILPDSIVSRFTSIGNLADTSTSYRVNIWRGAVRMLEDFWYCGIGVGEPAWFTTYPRYSLAAIEAAPHSHNLYLQTWIESGIVGLCLLLAFIVLLCQSNFSFFKKLSDMRASITDTLSISHLKPTDKTVGAQRSVVLRSENNAETAEKEITALRMNAAAPLCGVIASLLQGLTDYTWYNYRVFLMFWLVVGLSSAYVRLGQKELTHIQSITTFSSNTPDEAIADLPLLSAKPKKSRKDTEKGTPSHV